MRFTGDGWPICPHCERESGFRYDKGKDSMNPPPPCCGEPYCRAREYWTPDEWAGRARMAEAHRAAGGDLNDWDHEALRRAR